MIRGPKNQSDQPYRNLKSFCPVPTREPETWQQFGPSKQDQNFQFGSDFTLMVREAAFSGCKRFHVCSEVTGVQCKPNLIQTRWASLNRVGLDPISVGQRYFFCLLTLKIIFTELVSLQQRLKLSDTRIIGLTSGATAGPQLGRLELIGNQSPNPDVEDLCGSN